MIQLFTKKTPVILDTNFLLLPGSAGIDVVHEIQKALDEPHVICVTEATRFELKQIIEGNTSGKGKDKFNAKLGLVMIEQQGIKIINKSLGDGYADHEILKLIKEGTIVATLDKALQQEVLENKGRIITVKGKQLILKQ